MINILKAILFVISLFFIIVLMMNFKNSLGYALAVSINLTSCILLLIEFIKET